MTRNWSISLAICFLVSLLGALVGIVLTGGYAWDDGAITLSIARTLADHGEFALTAVSERVEGTSSLAFTFLIALAYSAWEMGFDAQILTGQLTSLAMLIATMLLLDAGLRRSAIPLEMRWLALLLFALNPMHFAEILNGMEMTLFGLCLTAFALSYSQRSNWTHVVVLVLLLTRFEALFYLTVGLGGIIACNRDERRWALQLMLGLLASFATITLVRLLYFGDIVPNTIWAKMHPPYSPAGSFAQEVAVKSLGLGDYLITMTGFLSVLVGLAALGARASMARDIKIWIMLAFAVFALMTGKNWGYGGRMFVGLLPVLVLAVVEHARPVFGSARSDMRIAIPLILALALSIGARSDLWLENARTVRTGAYFQGYAAPEKAVKWNLETAPDEYGITPVTYRDTGLRVDALRSILGLETISFLAPDMGGLGLCCPGTHIRVLDLALLLNRRLAHEGYGALGDYLEQERPDLIETHVPWTRISGLFEQVAFRTDYVPVVFENTLFWLRRDLLVRLEDRSDIALQNLEADFDLISLRYFKPPAGRNRTEFEYLQSYGTENIRVIEPAGN